MDKCKVGQSVRVSWSGRTGRVVEIHPNRQAGIRVLIDGEVEHWGFNANELVGTDGY